MTPRTDDPQTAREELELTLMEHDASDVGEHVDDALAAEGARPDEQAR
jgi:hypothetical protein